MRTAKVSPLRILSSLNLHLNLRVDPVARSDDRKFSKISLNILQEFKFLQIKFLPAFQFLNILVVGNS